eukprot:282625_1
MAMFLCFLAVIFVVSNSKPKCSDKDPRVRKEWNSLTQPEREIYIKGMEQLAKKGIWPKFTQQHGAKDTIWQAHGGSAFLPWHRAFLHELQSQIRALGEVSGTDFSCFGMPYWNWAKESGKAGSKYTILNSGLG